MIRAIHPFGPQPGEYINSAATDITVSIAREKQRLAKQRVIATAQAGACVLSGDELHPSLASLLTGWTPEEEAAWIDFEAWR